MLRDLRQQMLQILVDLQLVGLSGFCQTVDGCAGLRRLHGPTAAAEPVPGLYKLPAEASEEQMTGCHDPNGGSSNRPQTG